MATSETVHLDDAEQREKYESMARHARAIGDRMRRALDSEDPVGVEAALYDLRGLGHAAASHID